MKFNSFIESLREKGDSQFSDNQLSTDVVSIDQISHPISNDRRELFYKYAEAKGVIQKFNNIVIGEIGNFTEKKLVTHFEYKKGNKKNFLEDQRSILSIAEKIRINFKRVIIFSIGGSNLGPSLMNDIFNKHDLKIIFITGSDPDEYSNIKIQDDDALVISSKSFGTLETLSSYKEVCGNGFYNNTFAITANKSRALDFGVYEENIVTFDSSTGGRFSIWSPINLVLCLLEGEKGYKDFLEGGKEMDDACIKDPEDNPAFQLSVQDIIYNNLLNKETTLVVNYDYKLRNFISFAQQVEMESNGKSIDSNNNKVDYQTGSIIWGGYGPISQHSFFQHVFQGTKLSNKYFICSKSNKLNYKQMVAQIQSLVQGDKQEIDIHKKTNISGATKIELKDLSPYSIGQLLSLWENKTILNSIFWNTNAFDQWGVELGKINTKKQL
jgi:glucose-6-phosphate isomerase